MMDIDPHSFAIELFLVVIIVALIAIFDEIKKCRRSPKT